jgi:hypothetical protein
MTKMRSGQMPVADMQWQAQKIAKQAARLADQARPMTAKAASSARQGAGSAKVWATPKVSRIRSLMATGAAKSSVSVQQTVAPRVSAMLAATARKLDPPMQKTQARRWPKLIAGMTLLAAAGAAAAALQMRKSRPAASMPPPPRPPKNKTDTNDPSVKVLNPSADADFAMREAEMNGLSRSK